MTTEEKNKALVRRLIEEVTNQGNLDVADELLAPDFVAQRNVPRGKGPGMEDYKRVVAERRAASSDIYLSIEEQIAEGDRVVTRVIGSGTHDQGEYMGIAQSGVRITMGSIVIDAMERSAESREWIRPEYGGF
jgi:predicted ester cyclase